MKNRQKQIEEMSEGLYPNDDIESQDSKSLLIIGALWADSNPIPNHFIGDPMFNYLEVGAAVSDAVKAERERCARLLSGRLPEFSYSAALSFLNSTEK